MLLVVYCNTSDDLSPIRSSFFTGETESGEALGFAELALLITQLETSLRGGCKAIPDQPCLNETARVSPIN